MAEQEGDLYEAGRSLLGEAIRERRKKAGLTQKQLAETAGLSLSMVVSLEVGRVLPSLPSLDAVARALGTTGRELLRGVRPWDDA